MKMGQFSAFVALLSAVLLSCNPSEQNEASNKTKIIEKLSQPFRFHKAIEVKPGLTFDVVTWGRGGADSVGAYTILRSDSTHLKFQATEGALEGKVVDAWNMDMDADGNPEIFIQAADKNETLKLYVYEFGNDGDSREIDFPKLTEKTRKMYRGRDSVYVKDGKLRREFSLYNEGDADNKPGGGKKIVEYSLINNRFDIHEVE